MRANILSLHRSLATEISEIMHIRLKTLQSESV